MARFSSREREGQCHIRAANALELELLKPLRLYRVQNSIQDTMTRFQTVIYCWFLVVVSVLGLSITSTTITNLGVDVEGSARLNGGSFQQSPVTSYNGW